MKIRSRGGNNKIQLDMTPMIDVVFQLMIFFMCTFKVIEPEGDFDISMPLGAPSAAASTEAELPQFKVRMEADGNGDLQALYFNETNLGSGDQAFARLDSEVFRAITALQAIGPDQQEKQEVEMIPIIHFITGTSSTPLGRVPHDWVRTVFLSVTSAKSNLLPDVNPDADQRPLTGRPFFVYGRSRYDLCHLC